MKLLIAGLLLSLFCSLAAATPLTVVAAGDSQTVRYYPYLSAALANCERLANTVRVAAGGMRSTHFDGSAVLTTSADDYVAVVEAADPDVILFMLGVNEAYADGPAVSQFSGFKLHMSGILDRFDAMTNSRGQNPYVLLGTIPPMDPVRNLAYTGYASATGCNDRIEDWYNPWIREAAAARGYALIDLWALINADPANLLGPDGLHFNSAGSLAVAGAFAAAVPEPRLLAAGSLLTAVLTLRHRSRSRGT